MRQQLSELSIATKGRGFYEFTGQVEDALAKSNLQTGITTIHLQHTSASLVIQENADPTVRKDFERFFARLIPDGDPIFCHTSEGDDDMSAHIRTALTTVNLTIPFSGGKLCLGTWQGIYLWEHRTSAHKRKVTIHFLGE